MDMLNIHWNYQETATEKDHTFFEKRRDEHSSRLYTSINSNMTQWIKRKKKSLGKE